MLESRAVKISTVDDLQAVLDEEHWREHIVRHHPEMEDNFDLLVDTLQNARELFIEVSAIRRQGSISKSMPV